VPDIKDIQRAIRELSHKRVLVGIPQENDSRPGETLGNAAIGYIQEFGGVHIPARPHLVPGVEKALPEVTKRLEAAATAAMRGDSGAVDSSLGQAGQIAADSVRAYIRSNIPPPLSPATVRGRTTGHRRRRREAGQRGMSLAALAREEIAGGGAIALIDTGSYIRSITYVVRED
jgi:hypothetical protein